MLKGSHRAAVRWAGIVLIVFAVLTVGATVAFSLSPDENLSPLEITLFTLLTMLFSVLGSALLGDWLGEERSRGAYEELARPALRRIIELDNSAVLISQAITDHEAKLAEANMRKVDSARVAEWLDSTSRLLALHRGQLQAGIQDWRELLPSDYQEAIELRQMDTELRKQLAELELRIEEGASADEVASLRKSVTRLNKELRRKTTASPSPLIGYSTAASEPFQLGLSAVKPAYLGGNFTMQSDGTIVFEKPPAPGTVRVTTPRARDQGEDRAE